MTYNWQQPDWPEFRYDTAGIERRLQKFIAAAGRISGLLEGVHDSERTEVIIDLMVSEALKTSAIEGEYYSREDVRSSVRNHLGVNQSDDPVRDPRVRGIASIVNSVRETYHENLTEDALFAWHRQLMDGKRGITAGNRRLLGPSFRFVPDKSESGHCVNIIPCCGGSLCSRRKRPAQPVRAGSHSQERSAVQE